MIVSTGNKPNKTAGRITWMVSCKYTGTCNYWGSFLQVLWKDKNYYYVILSAESYYKYPHAPPDLGCCHICSYLPLKNNICLSWSIGNCINQYHHYLQDYIQHWKHQWASCVQAHLISALINIYKCVNKRIVWLKPLNHCWTWPGETEVYLCATGRAALQWGQVVWGPRWLTGYVEFTTIKHSLQDKGSFFTVAPWDDWS